MDADEVISDSKSPAGTGVRHSLPFRARGLVAAVIFFPAIVLANLTPPLAAEGSLLDWFFDSLGWTFLVLYVTCRIWATLFVGGRKDHRLQTDGIYSLTRNPLYLGSTCLALSVCFFLQSPLLFVLTLCVLAWYIAKVIRSEEVILRRLFGNAFDDYARTTPRFFPSFSNYRRPAGVSVDLLSIGREARRLWAAALFPLVGELMVTLRGNPHWPHLFHTL